MGRVQRAAQAQQVERAQRVWAVLSGLACLGVALGLFGWGGYDLISATTGEKATATVETCETHRSYGRRGSRTRTECYGSWQQGGQTVRGRVHNVGREEIDKSVSARVRDGEAYVFSWVGPLAKGGVGGFMVLGAVVWLVKGLRHRTAPQQAAAPIGPPGVPAQRPPHPAYPPQPQQPPRPALVGPPAQHAPYPQRPPQPGWYPQPGPYPPVVHPARPGAYPQAGPYPPPGPYPQPGGYGRSAPYPPPNPYVRQPEWYGQRPGPYGQPPYGQQPPPAPYPPAQPR